MFRIRRAAARALSNAFPPSAPIGTIRSRVTVQPTLKPMTIRSFSIIQPRFAQAAPSEEITESDGAQVSSDHSEQSEIRAANSEAPVVSPDQEAAATSESTDEIATEQAIDSTTKAAKETPKQSKKRNIVFVSNLSFDVTFQEMHDFVSAHGTVTRLHVPLQDSGLNKGMAFVQYGTEEEAQAAIQALKGLSLDGRKIDAYLAHPTTVIRPQRRERNVTVYEPTNSIFIGNLNYDLTDKELSDIFRDVKDVIDVRVAIDRKTGNPRGFAHADFPDVEAAQAAMDKLKGMVLHNRELYITFAKNRSSP